MTLFRRTRTIDPEPEPAADPTRRWERRYCRACEATTRHELVRGAAGVERALVTCTACGHRQDGYW